MSDTAMTQAASVVGTVGDSDPSQQRHHQGDLAPQCVMPTRSDSYSQSSGTSCDGARQGPALGMTSHIVHRRDPSERLLHWFL